MDAFNIIYLVFESLRLLALIIFLTGMIRYLRLARKSHRHDSNMIITLIFLSLQLLCQIIGSVMNFLDRDLKLDMPVVPTVAAILYGVVFFSQNTALFFNIARWYVILKTHDVVITE
jgi:hypothetical protein